MFALVMWMRSLFTSDATFMVIMIPTVLQGIAVATFFMPLQQVIYKGLAPSQMPAAAGLSNFVRITAGGFGTSISTTAWEHRATVHRAQLSESITPTNPAAVDWLERATQQGLSELQALAQLERVMEQQAYTLAVADLFLISAVLFVLLTGVQWMTRLRT
jgi:DHA2 family multidrug resistance protein